PLRRPHLDDSGRTVSLGAQLDALISRDDGQRSMRRQHGTGDDAQTVAERATLRQAQQLLDRIGRRMLKSEAISCGVPSRPRLRSSTKYTSRSLSKPDRHEVAASSALSASSFRTRRRSLSAGTPAFCWSPSMERNSAQSWRSAIFKFGSFSSPPRLLYWQPRGGARL